MSQPPTGPDMPSGSQPPLPDGVDQPQPPGIAERLVAQSGFAVYEPGSNIFDEPVLVYVSRPSQHWPDFDICDHVGRPLGHSRSKRSHRGGSVSGAECYDEAMNSLFQVKSYTRFANRNFTVTSSDGGSGGSGRTGQFDAIGRGTSQLVITANNERYGTIAGSRLAGLTSSSLRILDHQSEPVGLIRSFTEGLRFKRVTHYVISLNPGPSSGARNELRRALVTVPSMIAILVSRSS